jgi:hypothetical protein
MPRHGCISATLALIFRQDGQDPPSASSVQAFDKLRAGSPPQDKDLSAEPPALGRPAVRVPAYARWLRGEGLIGLLRLAGPICALGAWRHVVKPNQVYLVALAVFGHFEQIENAQET